MTRTRLRSAALAAALAARLAAVPGAGARWFDPPPATPTAAPAPSPTSPGGPPESAARCEIDVLDREPAVPFDLVAIVEVQSRVPEGDPGDLVGSAQVRACELGGDGLVVLWRREPRRSGMAVPPGARGLLPEPGLRAAVIRYR